MDLITIRNSLVFLLVLISSLEAVGVKIDGKWSNIKPSKQPTVEIESPFGLELPVTDESFVTWTWERNLTVWKPKESRIEIEGAKGVYTVGWTIRTINFTEGRMDKEEGQLTFRIGKEVDKPSEPKPEPPEEPSKGFEDLVALAKKAVQINGDKATAKKLGEFYLEWSKKALPNIPLQNLIASVRKGVGNVMFERVGDANWEDTWRIPSTNLLKKHNTSEKYIAAIKACGEAFLDIGQLRAVRISTPSRKVVPPTLIVYKSANCSLCVQWDREVKPKIKALGITIISKTTTGNAPRFTYISRNGKMFPTFVGYLPYDQFRSKLSNEWRSVR